jgi:hypothetical protein
MPKPLQESDLAKLVILAALLFGGWLRFYPVLQAGFLLNKSRLAAFKPISRPYHIFL